MTPDAGHIYVIALTNGTIKVGRTQDAPRRLREHKTHARSLGLTITDTWISPLHAEWHSNEDLLKKIAADLGGTPLSREVFSNVEFGTVVEQAKGLAFTEPEPLATPVPARSVPEPAQDAERRPLRHGCLTPRERAIALAALEAATAQDVRSLMRDNRLKLHAVTLLLDEGLPADYLEQLMSDGPAHAGVAGMTRAMETVIRFECDIELAIARREVAELRREAATKAAIAEAVYA